MLYLQLKERVILLPGQRLTVGDLADGVGEGAAEAMKQPVPCWLNTGVWRLPAAALVQAVLPVRGQVTTLGPAEVMVHVQVEKKRAAGGLRTAAAFTLLFLGSALAITWFHADVGMREAQSAFFRLLAGREPSNPWLMTVPYALGVGLGVSFYYALLPGKKTVSPLEVKLAEYKQKTEQQAARIP